MTIESSDLAIARIKASVAGVPAEDLAAIETAGLKIANWPQYPLYHDPANGGGHNADDPLPSGSLPPYCMYFYYLRIDQDGMLRVTHYYFNDASDPIKNLDQLITAIAIFARTQRWDGSLGKRPEMLRFANFKHIEYNRISYVVYFLDEANWDFLLDNGKPVVPFHVKKGSQPCEPNYSFYDANVYPIEMPKSATSDTRHALVMTNLMQNKDGKTLTKEDGEQHFAFDLLLRVKFANANEYDQNGQPMPDTDDRRLTVNFDPGGTNLGPPIPPPALP